MKLRHYLSIVLAVALVAGVAATVYLRDSGEFGAMTVRSEGGRVEIHRGNSVIPVGTDGESLEPQDVVVTGPGGLATLKLEDGRKFTLARKTRLRIRSTRAVEPQAGTIVATSEDAPTDVVFDDVTARFSSATFRLDRGFGSTRAATFGGTVRLESPGESRLELTRLMQVEVAAGDLPERAVPYRLGLNDFVDGQYLGDVVQLTKDLDLLATGFARQISNERPGVTYFADLADANVNFMQPYLSRPTTDLLVAFTIADNDPDASLNRSFKAAFRFLDAGASYGVAASLLEVKPVPLVAQLKELIVDTGAVVAGGDAGEATFGDGAIASGDSGTADSDGGTIAAPGGETVSGGVEGETNGTVDDCENTLDCGLQDVQDEIPPGPGPNTGPGEEEEEEPPTDTILPGDGGDGGLLDDGGILGGGN